MEIEVQGDFLEVEKKVVTSEDFIGSVYGVEYIIHQEKIGNGRHYGRITVRQGKQELRFELEVTNSEKHVTSRKNTERDRQITAIARGYLDLAVHKRDYRTWYQDTWEAIEQFEKAGGDMAWVTLGKAWLYESRCRQKPDKAENAFLYNYASANISGSNNIGGLFGKIDVELYNPANYFKQNYFEIYITTEDESTSSPGVGSRKIENSNLPNTYIYKYGTINDKNIDINSNYFTEDKYLVEEDLKNTTTYTSKLLWSTSYWNFDSLQNNKYPLLSNTSYLLFCRLSKFQ